MDTIIDPPSASDDMDLAKPIPSDDPTNTAV